MVKINTVSISDLQKSRYSTARVPEHRRQVRHRFSLLAELQQGILSCFWAGELIDPLIDLLTVHLRQTRCGYSLKREKEIIKTILDIA